MDSNLSDLHPDNRIKKLAEEAEPQVDFTIPARRYFRSGKEMVRMATVYYDEGKLEEAYKIYLRFSILFLDKIKGHPEFNTKNEDFKDIKEKLQTAIPRAEELKNKLLKKYKIEYEAHLQNVQRQKEQQQLKAQQRPQPVAPQMKPQSAPAERRLTAGKSDLANQVAIVPALPDDDILYPPPLTVQVPSEKPLFDRSNKPASLLNSQPLRHGLRPVIVPAKLIHEFLVLADRNTISNKETCGILAGKLSQDKLVITHLLVPEQNGTPDSCTTQNEEALFAFQDKFDLITLGWIHTHPTQTAFLSSVDLHTHCSYQLMMPEALAIVCAPRYDNYRCFCLTHDYGLRYIANCPIKNGFHPHPSEPPLFMEAEHAIVDDQSFIHVVDLRK
ncbi:unnamed protein product [Bemisia tabaci]|uniref:MPN domain-containing protein n=1 Tax=Bemisia tabaci TaxID=7038 RepID=A0A9P0AP54_BEMTA|nr:unnamed protein product [Bemisia tabaci]